jgi:bla regulator protein BlaR1
MTMAISRIAEDLSGVWSGIAPALGNHLWQSTLFALAAGLLTLLLRKNQARVRYWLWLAASLKFLIPFSLLVVIGSHLAWLRSSRGANAGFYFAMEEIVIAPAISSNLFQRLIHLLPAPLVALWLAGFLVVLGVWCVRWRRISLAMRGAMPLREGREVEALRGLEVVAGMRRPIELLLSQASLEPGIFGIARPVLVWPKGISKRLDGTHLQAILAHEVCHVRRRDNLAAAIHMVVEAIFWFHPLVWWLGARMVEEREHACDERVLELGSDRQVYAESILKVCQFCVESPLTCVAGVTGADLKKRMVAIMNENGARKLDFGRKLLLSVAGLLAIAVPIVFGLTNAIPSQAESQDESAAAKGEPSAPLHVPKDVMQKLIREKVPPQYPDEARKARIQGTVVLDATISKTGDIENLRLISGHPMLAPAAIEAVKQWKYKPYLLKGEPVGVETQVQINFMLGK